MTELSMQNCRTQLGRFVDEIKSFMEIYIYSHLLERTYVC
jgi:hypothetical protein